MLASKIKEIMFTDGLSNDEKICRIAALFDAAAQSPAKVDYVDFIITHNRITKLRHLLPKNREIASLEVLKVRRLTAPNTRNPISDYQVVGVTKMTNGNSQGIRNLDFEIMNGSEIGYITLHFGFVLRAIRAECTGLLPFMVGENQLSPFPEITVRFHFAN